MIHKKKILVVEDDLRLSKVYSMWLNKAGFECSCVHSGDDATITVDQVKFDLILSDVMMPEGTGFDVCRYVRKSDLNRNTPIVLLSSMKGDKEIEHGLNQGANDYLLKPINNHLLIAKINAIIELYHRAMNVNPLTGLPGNISIRDYCESLLKSHQDFSLIYFDIDNFKPYNDTYGYNSGDNVIRFLAQTMIDSRNGEKIFLGHVGGDDFVAVLDNNIAEDYAYRVVNMFDEHIHSFYDDGHKTYGYIEGVDRRGNTVRFPLMRVSAGVTSTLQHSDANYHELTEFATECKSVAKACDDKVYIDGRVN